MDPLIVVLIIVAVIIAFFSALLSLVPIGLWISAIAAGVKVSLTSLIGMKFRRVQPAKIVNPLIKSTKAGLNVTINQLETHYLAGGNVNKVADALIAAQKARIQLSLKRLLLLIWRAEMFWKRLK